MRRTDRLINEGDLERRSPSLALILCGVVAALNVASAVLMLAVA